VSTTFWTEQRRAYSFTSATGESMPPQTGWAKLPEMVRHDDDPLALYQLAYALFIQC